jgi:hypothetical protein
MALEFSQRQLSECRSEASRDKRAGYFETFLEIGLLYRRKGYTESSTYLEKCSQSIFSKGREFMQGALITCGPVSFVVST